uniref:Superoxide dismutase copper/zinc binding domain-containing protein n=1 Tax=Poecilia reticulata TaxID=8081 RepID=A0A3P9MSS3_POERE
MVVNRAVMNMRGISGYFNFRQASPFDVTQLSVNLTNLRELVGPYHVHNFPVPSVRSGQCSNDNVGGHWNPFAVDTTSPPYPAGPGSTHDKYEIGDLSGKHMSLSGRSTFQMTFTDFNLPLFGQNSIVGRSVVIHLVGGDRSFVLKSGNSILACADILPESQFAEQTFPNVSAFSR